MTLAQLLNRPCTIIRRRPSGARNAYNDEVPDQSAVETVCELQQRQRDENDSRGELGRSQWLLILPAGTDVRLGDAITVDGHVYELVGDPWHARNPRTRLEEHIEATVERTAATGDTGS